MLLTPSGDRRVLARHFPHPQGVLVFDLYWHLGRPDERMHVLAGEIKGEGPWRFGDSVINILGCQGSDPELAMAYEQWQQYLLQVGADYPPVRVDRQYLAAVGYRYGDKFDAYQGTLHRVGYA